ncbi:MAG: malto-oligosyltrehalose synthase, partial [Gordonia sp. (in: high G+C Gram-positive bacteria)]|uniref:malto-oligosyltrehalose synthase n=1 Tax=Gordonia sp. (in: high G+C Gram-positive bacteria) TaxID=84139 RepID=UPI003BB4ED62
MTAIPREPVATYRIQLTEDFAFAEVVGILDDLVELGISHLYLSPILAAMPGSTHGYDWAPPARIAEALGGIDGFRLLRGHAAAVGIGILIDIVGHHVGIRDARHNPWWADVLRYGRDSRYADYFDLALRETPGADERIVLPYLGSIDDLEALLLDNDGYLHLHEWVLPTARGTAHPGDDPRVVLDRQRYRLILATESGFGYRRFVDISELAALATEVDDVFEASHAWLRALVAEDLIDGVRVDHLDGFRDIPGYLTRLRALVGDERLIYVEKLLAVDESLDRALPVDGTTGYDQLQLIEAAFTSPPGILELDEIYHWTTGFHGDGEQLAALARTVREETLRKTFTTRLRWASTEIAAVPPGVPLHLAEQAVAAFVTRLTISRPDTPQSRQQVHETITLARAALPGATAGFDALAAVFTHPEAYPDAIFRVSDLAAVVAAKAIEAVGFHRTARLVSTQELGCNPRRPTISRADFHERNQQRAHWWPLAMTALTTHDTKRSSDVRARIAVIAQVPQRWNLLVREIWRRYPPPHERTAYLLLQNLVGIWPVDGPPDADLAGRISAYTTKAIREAGVISSWAEQNLEAEQQTQDWISRVTVGDAATRISEFVALIAPTGREESLSRVALGLLGPGVGDLYQGTQWWYDALTDPDNRRPVDYRQDHHHPKFRLISEALAVRRRHSAAFGRRGRYLELSARGDRARHVLA